MRPVRLRCIQIWLPVRRLDGMQAQMGAAGVDLGAAVEAPVEEAVAEEAVQLRAKDRVPRGGASQG